jgi:O-antigen/teichoic acid export membrane protein
LKPKIIQNSEVNPVRSGSDNPSAPSLTDKPAGLLEDHNDRHFRTDHLLTNLKQRTISSGFITVASQGLKFVLTMGSTMVLARLLTPQDFGLVAMVTTVTGFLRVFKDLGLSTATIQRETITQAQVSNLFWINVVVSALLTLVVILLAPAVAWFYREPRLVGVTLALSVTFLFSGSTVQHTALLYRQMRFKAVALVEVGSMTVGVVGGISAAWGKFGYWSLVIASVVTEVTAFLLTWSVSSWRPSWPILRSGTRSMVGFGANLTMASFINCISKNIDSMLLGRFYGAYSVGIYSRAMALLLRPLDQILTPVNAVIEPTLARLQGQPERFRRTFLQIYNALVLVGFIITAILIALSRPVTLVLLGPQWEKAAAIFAGFAGLALYAPLASALGFLLVSQGRGRDMLTISVVTNVLVVAGILSGLAFGPVGVAIGGSVAGLFGAIPYIYYKVGRQGPVRTKDLWMVLLKLLPLWGSVFGVTFIMQLILADMKPILQLLICSLVGLLAGAAVICSINYTRHTALQIMRAISDAIGHRGQRNQPAAEN